MKSISRNDIEIRWPGFKISRLNHIVSDSSDEYSHLWLPIIYYRGAVCKNLNVENQGNRGIYLSPDESFILKYSDRYADTLYDQNKTEYSWYNYIKEKHPKYMEFFAEIYDCFDCGPAPHPAVGFNHGPGACSVLIQKRINFTDGPCSEWAANEFNRSLKFFRSIGGYFVRDIDLAKQMNCGINAETIMPIIYDMGWR